MLHWVDVGLHALVGAVAWLRPGRGWVRHTPAETLDIRAVRMAWMDIIVDDTRAREALGYETLVSKAECIREARGWCVDTYAQLSNR